jgi:hypothetical protein
MTLRLIVQLRIANALATKPPSLPSYDQKFIVTRMDLRMGVWQGVAIDSLKYH